MKKVMPENKIIEKYYIETEPNLKKKLLSSLLSGLCWGIGATFGTAVFITIIGIIISKIDFVPILGQFLAEIIKIAQINLANQ